MATVNFYAFCLLASTFLIRRHSSTEASYLVTTETPCAQCAGTWCKRQELSHQLEERQKSVSFMIIVSDSCKRILDGLEKSRMTILKDRAVKYGNNYSLYSKGILAILQVQKRSLYK